MIRKIAIKNKIGAAICALLLAAAVLCAFVFAVPALSESDAARPVGYKGVLRLWHIDGFEGGKGDRASFLARVARAYESANEGVLIMITSHTPESAEDALDRGFLPDMISYGGDCAFAADIAFPLAKYDCAAASAGGETLGVPWCEGGYFLFTAEGDFSDVSAENTVLSQGRGTFPVAAAALEGLRGAFEVQPSVQAYVSLIDGKYKYMLGTQRDVWRFSTRGFSVEAKPVESFSDIRQYLSVCTGSAEKYNACLDFLDLLLSEEVQKQLVSVGMCSPYFEIYGEEGGAMRALEKTQTKNVLGAFLQETAREEFEALAESLLKGEENGAKKIKNYLL